MLREVITLDTDHLGILREVCEAIPLADIRAGLAEDPPETLDQLLTDMYDTMLAENGMGLAANQIGYKLRIFILKGDRGSYIEYINPEVLSQEEPVKFENEGCLSIPGTTGPTTRYRKLRLRWQDRHGITNESDFTDIQAFAVQHEIDHLDGKLYIDQLGSVMKSLVLKKHKKYMRNLRRRG